VRIRAVLVAVALLALGAAVAQAAPKVSKRYAQAQSKGIAKERCQRDERCRSAAITECVRSHRSLVQCVVYVKLRPGETRSYCTYRIGTEYRGQRLRFWRSPEVCA
jgi:hypothetical protein